MLIIISLQVLVHVSTAYVTSTRSELNETIYRPVCDVDKLISTLDWLDDQTSNAVTKRLVLLLTFDSNFF